MEVSNIGRPQRGRPQQQQQQQQQQQKELVTEMFVPKIARRLEVRRLLEVR